MVNDPLQILVPDWPAPPRVRAAFTLRTGGVSAPPHRSLNVGTHVGDSPEAVRENRRRIAVRLSLPAEPAWLQQVHGTQVADVDDPRTRETSSDQGTIGPVADAAVTRCYDRVCVIQVADCMPVLFAVRDGSAVGAAHAGWRGLASGVLEATVRHLGAHPSQLIAWLGPAIGPSDFEVGPDVLAAFTDTDADASFAFVPNARGRWQCDLYALARRKLNAIGLTAVYGGGWCTFADAERFFSYRRDGQCGRMAALIWMDRR